MEAFECIAASSSDMTPRKTKNVLVPCSLFGLLFPREREALCVFPVCRARMFHVLYVDHTDATFNQHESWDMVDKGVRAHFRERTTSRGGSGRCG